MPPPPDDKKPPGSSVFRDPEDYPTKTAQLDRAHLEQATRDRAHLIILAGESVGQIFRIEQPEIVMGRAADATIRLQDDGVSRRHARIVHRDGEVWIEDLKSHNGTLVNGQRVQQSVLRDGDKVQLGSTMVLKFTYADELEENLWQTMYDAALHDGLTKAYNKRHFLDRLPREAAFARRHGIPLSLLILDIDHFKKVNDSRGHAAGDYVLATLASVVMGGLRAEDLFVRSGGEEFYVLCRGSTLENAVALAERLRVMVERSVFFHDGQAIPITISIGVASWSGDADADAKLTLDADAALYDAKRAGRNQVVARR